MSYDDALNLTTSGDNWNAYMTANSETELGYTLYIDGNPFPNYYFTDNPTNTAWSSTYTGTGANQLGVVADSKTFLTDDQADLITFYLSDITGIDYRVSFSDVSNLQFSDKNSPDATGELFISNGNISGAGAFGITKYPLVMVNMHPEFCPPREKLCSAGPCPVTPGTRKP